MSRRPRSELIGPQVTPHGKEFLLPYLGDCAICTETMTKEENDLWQLPCGHMFHTHCVQRWVLDHSSTCPSCRHDLSNKKTEFSKIKEHQMKQRIGEYVRIRNFEHIGEIIAVNSRSSRFGVELYFAVRWWRRRHRSWVDEVQSCLPGDLASLNPPSPRILPIGTKVLIQAVDGRLFSQPNWGARSLSTLREVYQYTPGIDGALGVYTIRFELPDFPTNLGLTRQFLKSEIVPVK
jgi:hypothetical protein